ncbi:ATP-binding cassette sub- C member 8 [Mortierella hygrophila]|uniref:ATP-binding cassette sub- C member 8 n=1 Tax=Mortierella hygrophila TaxID=979708 RepID=A0A9P6F4F8_9FUNG|nr:ATP-binding cassette sub- C member 8 [Mortierella hygrophila]
MNLAERLIHYIKNLAQEPPTATYLHRQPPLSLVWPSEGSLEFKNLTLRYRPDLLLVLRDISFSIHAGHKVGVVGRTDPVLFESTFRYNLDPLERHKEQELWQALEMSDLKSYVQAQEGGLDAVVLAKDMATDVLIQRAIRSDFADTIVMAIAHRISTIIDYDRILVMHDGQVAEYDTLQALLQDPYSIFSSLVNESGVLSR